jgi:hypothetical protein
MNDSLGDIPSSSPILTPALAQGLFVQPIFHNSASSCIHRMHVTFSVAKESLAPEPWLRLYAEVRCSFA